MDRNVFCSRAECCIGVSVSDGFGSGSGSCGIEGAG